MSSANRWPVAAGLVTLAGFTALCAAGNDTGTLFDFSIPQSLSALALQERFDGKLHPADPRGWMKSLASAPNHVGSPHDKANAEFVRELFPQWGWDALSKRSKCYTRHFDSTPSSCWSELAFIISGAGRLTTRNGEVTQLRPGSESPLLADATFERAL
jgi:hypothetical protein